MQGPNSSILKSAHTISLALMALMVSPAVNAATHYVSAGHPSGDGSSWFEAFGTVQEAVDAANEADTIMVGIGTYEETITVDKSLTLKGADPELTVMAGVLYQGTALTLTEDVSNFNVESMGFRDYQFAIQNPWDPNGQNVWIADCIFVDAPVGIREAFGIVTDTEFVQDVVRWPALTFVGGNATVLDTHFEDTDPGIVVAESTYSSSDTTIWENSYAHATGGDFIVVNAQDGISDINANRITNGRINLDGGENTVTNNIIDGDWHGGISLAGTTSEVYHNTIINAEIGISCRPGVWIDESVIANNYFGGAETALAWSVGCDATVVSNVAAGSQLTAFPAEYEADNTVYDEALNLSSNYRPFTRQSPLFRAGLDVDVSEDFSDLSRSNQPTVGAYEWPLSVLAGF